MQVLSWDGLPSKTAVIFAPLGIANADLVPTILVSLLSSAVGPRGLVNAGELAVTTRPRTRSPPLVLHHTHTSFLKRAGASSYIVPLCRFCRAFLRRTIGSISVVFCICHGDIMRVCYTACPGEGFLVKVGFCASLLLDGFAIPRN